MDGVRVVGPEVFPMCRWIAYLGSPLAMDALMFRPEHSLVEQSRHAQRSIYSTNADGFGLGWYTERPYPGIYHDTRPAWNDQNLRNLAEHISSKVFLAHVRATTGTPVQRTNCHPFRYKNWLFQHNGEIFEFEKIKREVDMEIAPELYPEVLGSTDSERIFYLALTLGLQKDPEKALARTVGWVETARDKFKIKLPFRITAALTDGKRLWAIRYSSHRKSPTLYHSLSTAHAIRDICGESEELPKDGRIVLSEPLDNVSEHWEEVPESTLLKVENGEVTQKPFQPL